MSNLVIAGDRNATLSNLGVTINGVAAPDFAACHRESLTKAVNLCVKQVFNQAFFTQVMADLKLDPTKGADLRLTIEENRLSIINLANNARGQIVKFYDASHFTDETDSPITGRSTLLSDTLMTAKIQHQQHQLHCSAPAVTESLTDLHQAATAFSTTTQVFTEIGDEEATHLESTDRPSPRDLQRTRDQMSATLHVTGQQGPIQPPSPLVSSLSTRSAFDMPPLDLSFLDLRTKRNKVPQNAPQVVAPVPAPKSPKRKEAVDVAAAPSAMAAPATVDVLPAPAVSQSSAAAEPPAQPIPQSQPVALEPIKCLKTLNAEKSSKLTQLFASKKLMADHTSLNGIALSESGRLSLLRESDKTSAEDRLLIIEIEALAKKIKALKQSGK